jgi:DNA-directed RNA polymerase subunit RPC12/RpoP
MSKTADALKLGVEAIAEDLRPGQFEANGRTIRCPYCGGEEFVHRGLTLPQGIELGISCTACGTTVVPPHSPERLGDAS